MLTIDGHERETPAVIRGNIGNAVCGLFLESHGYNN